MTLTCRLKNLIQNNDIYIDDHSVENDFCKDTVHF